MTTNTVPSFKVLPRVFNDESSALVVDDYPYGFKLRCKIRYWVEFKKGHGYRFCSQTTNPKITVREHWNAAKKGTYSKEPILMIQELENDHISYITTSYWDEEKAKRFFDLYAHHLNADEIETFEVYFKVREKRKELDAQAQEKAKERLLDPIIVELEDGKLYTKSHIVKSTVDMELYRVSAIVKGIKKRCRNQDQYIETLGFMNQNANYDRNELRKAANIWAEGFFKDKTSHGVIRVKITKVTFNAPTEGSPLFYGFKEMLLQHDDLFIATTEENEQTA